MALHIRVQHREWTANEIPLNRATRNTFEPQFDPFLQFELFLVTSTPNIRPSVQVTSLDMLTYLIIASLDMFLC